MEILPHCFSTPNNHCDEPSFYLVCLNYKPRKLAFTPILHLDTPMVYAKYKPHKFDFTPTLHLDTPITILLREKSCMIVY